MESENYIFVEVKVEEGKPKVEIKAKGFFEKYVPLIKKMVNIVFSLAHLMGLMREHADELSEMLRDVFKETFGEELEDSDGSREEQS